MAEVLLLVSGVLVPETHVHSTIQQGELEYITPYQPCINCVSHGKIKQTVRDKF